MNDACYGSVRIIFGIVTFRAYALILLQLVWLSLIMAQTIAITEFKMQQICICKYVSESFKIYNAICAQSMWLLVGRAQFYIKLKIDHVAGIIIAMIRGFL